MRETPECSQYFMKKLGGKNPEMEKWGIQIMIIGFSLL